jgi:3-hydroxybutyryl-CoA dehydrogenase
MNIDRVRTICVVGAGTMGSQIAQQCALYGYSVWLMDTDADQLERAVQSNQKHLQRRVDRGKLSADQMEAALELVRVTSDLAEATDTSDFVIEAVVERLEVKQGVFAQLERLCSPQAILATNSSTIGISQIVRELTHRERCINMHFFHPVLVMQLVEVMRGPDTSQATVDTTMELASRIGKEPVLINREVYGLLVNRILGAIKREAFWLAEEGYATPEDIDRAVRLGLNHPMGPFELADFSGLDIFYYASLQRYRETGDEQDKPPRILEEKVREGHLGVKTGRGFYDYSEAQV